MPAGLEYVLVDSQEPHLFVLRRQLRGAPGTPPEPQAVYYILDGTVYQAPAIGAVLSARLVREGLGVTGLGGGGFGTMHALAQASMRCLPPLSLQDRCLWSMQAAFKRMQADLDPLGTGGRGVVGGGSRCLDTLDCPLALGHGKAARCRGGACPGHTVHLPASNSPTHHSPTPPDAATAALPPPAPPTRRYTDAERARIQQADRVISSVLQGIVAPAVGGDGASLGAGEGGFAEPAPSAATGAS